MIVNIDWISFTFPFVLQKDEDGVVDAAISFERALEMGWGDRRGYLDTIEDWKSGGGRRPYSNSVFSASSGIYFWSSPVLNHVLCEITGTGCEALRRSDLLYPLIAAHQDHITRIDIACDMETEVAPLEFADVRGSKRFKSGGYKRSESGETVYVGSKSSDRYARIYRYNSPHPRSHLLRCEMVFRAEQAREVAKLSLQSSPYDLAAQCGAIYKWEHHAWQTGVNDPTPVSSWSEERGMGSTVRWMFSQVLPAAKRVIDQGESEHVLMFCKELLAYISDGDYNVLIAKK